MQHDDNFEDLIDKIAREPGLKPAPEGVREASGATVAEIYEDDELRYLDEDYESLIADIDDVIKQNSRGKRSEPVETRFEDVADILVRGYTEMMREEGEGYLKSVEDLKRIAMAQKRVIYNHIRFGGVDDDLERRALAAFVAENDSKMALLAGRAAVINAICCAYPDDDAAAARIEIEAFRREAAAIYRDLEDFGAEMQVPAERWNGLPKCRAGI